MRKCIVTQAVFERGLILQYCRPTFEKYALKHGYDLKIHTEAPIHTSEETSPARLARACKARLIQDALLENDIVLWLDADVMISRYDTDILDEMDPQSFQGLVLEIHPERFNPNTGVWLLRNTELAHNFLSQHRNMDDIDHVWVDQAKVMRLLGWELGDYVGRGAKPVHESKYLAGTQWLAPEWNPLGLLYGMPQARFRHYAGQPTEMRMISMAAEVASQKKYISKNIAH